ncbi:MAG: PKD domain-containing protein, partial [Methanospirillum sp.]|uniref:PKD domain-containing protein n=1 Tax=Methanospirillum sp. TaxID=45200 RepID=UPI00236D28B5
LCFCLLIISTVGMVVGATETNNSIPRPGMSELKSSHIFLPGFDNLTIPTPPVQINDHRNVGSAAENNNQIVSTLTVADTGMNTMGNVVLEPITPTPVGSGYSYYNTTGTDPSYLIYASGTYTLRDGFSTDNSSALRIVASDVVLDGNAQTILGNYTNTGITIYSGKTNTTVRNFAGIREFNNGVDSFGSKVSLTNNSLSDNYYGGVNASGSDLTMTHNILFNNTDFGVFMEGTGAEMTENSVHDTDGFGLYFYGNNVSLYKNSISKNGYGVIFLGNNSVMDGNNIVYNEHYGTMAMGNGATYKNNIISQNEQNLLFMASNTTINNNTISSTTDSYGRGIYSIANNVTFSENTINNNAYGIIAIGDKCTARNNRAYSNTMYGIAIQGENVSISDNIIRDTGLYGVACYGNNSVMQDNIVTNATFGAGIVDIYNTTVIGNQIASISRFGILILDSEEGTGEGTIYNNFLGSQTNIGGYGNFSNYSYILTNPAGPQRGTNVVGGPFIAGNYWSNTTGTGWSDQQTPNVTGYTTTPYELVSGLYDTAPLVPQKSVTINATANDWSNIVPRGNNSYQPYTNQTFITQAKPGAALTDVLVDSNSKGNVTNWTFTQLSEDHEIQAIGDAKPGQVLVFFNASPRWGEMPLTVSFSSDQSLGSPTSWFWQFGDGGTNATQNPVHTYDTPGTYTVTLRSTNNQTGGYALWNNYVTVTDGPVPEPTQTPVPGKIITQFSAYPASGSAPLTVDFRDMSSGNPVSWNWDFGDGTQSTLQNSSHIYTSAGSYPVTLSVTNVNNGASLSIPNAVVVT